MTRHNQNHRRLVRTFFDLPSKHHCPSKPSNTLSRTPWSRGITWEELLKSKRIQIISEAGTGKTYECRAEQESRWENGEAVFYFELAQLGGSQVLTDLMSADEIERYEAWLKSQSDIAIMFLDSVDELKLTQGSFETALKQLRRSLASHLGRVTVVVTARPIPIDDMLMRKHLPVPDLAPMSRDEAFADVAVGPMINAGNEGGGEKPTEEWRRVELQPLSDDQIANFANIQGVEDPSALLADIRARGAEEFARRPQDLIELCVDWREHQRIRTHREQVETNLAVKAKGRIDRREESPLAIETVVKGASQLALAMLLTRKLNLRYNVESDKGEAGTALDPLRILTGWSTGECQTLMERPLFGFAGYGRVRFHNQSMVEYLAARQLNTLMSEGMSWKVVRRILFAQTLQGYKVVKPTMRPVAAWLALSHEPIRRELREREPEVLIAHGDPESLTPDQRIQVLRAYVERYGSGGRRGHGFARIQLKRFGSDDLAGAIMQVLQPKPENSEARQFLFELIAAVPIAGCAHAAFEVAMNPESEVGERIYAVESLVNLKDRRVSKIVESMVEFPNNWPDRLFVNTIIRLFPSSIKMESLRKLIESRPESIQDCKDVGHFLADSLEYGACELSVDYLDALRATLTDLVLTGVKPLETWPYFLPQRKHLLAPLAAACLRLLKTGHLSDSVLESSIATIRLAKNSSTNETPIDKLRECVNELPSKTKREAFWIADAFNQRYCFEEQLASRVVGIVHCCELRIGEDDARWVLEELSNQDRTDEQRALLLEAAIGWTWDNKRNYCEFIHFLKTKVADSELLQARLEDRLRTPKVDLARVRMQKEHETHRQEQIRKEQEAHKSCLAFWQEVSNQPEIAFGEDQVENTTWRLWHAMTKSGTKGRSSGWNRRFVERYFDEETVDRLRVSLMKVWRNHKPTFISERPAAEKGSYFVRWQLGLAGIAAEAESTEWTAEFTSEEVELALRYVSVEFNGFPAWLTNLAAAHSVIVEDVLGRECISELNELADANGQFSFLQKVRYADSTIAKLFVRRLHAWFMKHNARRRDGEIAHKVMERLAGVTEVLLSHGDGMIREDILSVAARRLTEGIDPGEVKFWLSILIRLDPTEGTAQLEKNLADEEDADVAEQLFGQLFGNHHESSGCHFELAEVSPRLLFRLVKLAYTHIKPENDNVHDGVYDPDQRDNAQRGRSSLLNALLAKKGPDAWAAKVKMANDPLFDHFRDRALALALEKAAEESDSDKLSAAEVVELYANQESPPTTRAAMFEVLIDRLDDFDDLLLRDDSPREAWALIENERIMRREITRQLRTVANGAYTVDQESVTADEKETDIRLRSTASLQQAVIELKLGEKNRSGRELRESLTNQLVAKYMADDNCRSGCLLVTVAKDRHWQHPDSKEQLDPVGLEKMLREEARKIECEMGYSLSLTAKVFDLRPRLTTEKAVTKD